MREVTVSLLFLPFLFVALAFLVLCLAFGVRIVGDNVYYPAGMAGLVDGIVRRYKRIKEV
jgi:succinate-acetate transporter protein